MKLSAHFKRKDGPHSWIILFTIVVNGFVGLGWLFGSIGVFAEVFPDLLGVDAARASSLGSTLIGFSTFTVPLSTLFVKLAGSRVVAGVGGLLILISVVSSAFGTQLWHLLLSYSCIGGIGVAMNITSSVAIIPHYCERKKPGAYACLGLGEGIALVALPYILNSLLNAYGFKLTLLYISPMTLLSLVAVIVFIPQQESSQSSVTGSALVKSCFSLLKKPVSPFYLLNSLLWGGGLSSMIVLSFQYLVKVSQDSVALLSYSILGIAYLIGSLALVVCLLRFQVNHFVLQIIINGTMGIGTIAVTFLDWPIGYYICFAIIGIVYGLIVSNMPCLSAYLYDESQVEYAYGFMQVSNGVGSTAMPIIGGILQEKYGLQYGMYFSGGLLMLGALVLAIPALIQPKLWKLTTVETDSDVTSNNQLNEAGASSAKENEQKYNEAYIEDSL